MHNAQRRLLLLRNNELKTVTLDNDADLLHRVDDEVRPTILDLLPLVARAHSDHSRPRRDTRLDPRRRVLKDHTPLGIEPELRRSEEERVWGWLASLETLVAGGDGDLGWGEPDTVHAAVS